MCAPVCSGMCVIRGSNAGDQMERMTWVLGGERAVAFYRQFVSYWKQPAEALVDAELPQTLFDALPQDGMFEHMMLLDAQTYLPDDILVKVDRAAMAASLETRVPMIDHRVFEFAQSLPLGYKVRDGKGKWQPAQ